MFISSESTLLIRATDVRLILWAYLVLFNSFQAFAELPSQMTARSITSKQTGYAFYRPAALTIAQTLSDAPINMLKILIFCSIIYNLAGLSRTAGAFFTVSLVFAI